MFLKEALLAKHFTHWLFLRFWPILLLQHVFFKTSGKKTIQNTHLDVYFITLYMSPKNCTEAVSTLQQHLHTPNDIYCEGLFIYNLHDLYSTK